ncbi:MULTISPECIES: hypothetical protein [Paenibacillus]|uniref:hypothetical protein n=1 Tax=Paenibacillus TaxID=44249 RepID=UPI001C4CEF22|nr:hypothetical protein [Paenibacillus borealis]
MPGPAGPTGPQGLPGPTGPTGSTGPQGTLSSAFADLVLLSTAPTVIPPNVSIPLSSLISDPKRGFTFDAGARAAIAEQSGFYYVNYILYIQGDALPGAAFVVTVNNFEQSITISGNNTNTTNDVHLVGQGIIPITAGDAIRLTNTGTTNAVLLPFAGNQQVNMSSFVIFKIADL